MAGYNATTYATWQQKQLSLVNLGQLKMTFSFDLSNFLRPEASFNAWATGFGLNLTDSNLTNETPAGDGVSNWLKYQANENPNDYIYSAANATNLTLNITAGNNQVGNPGDTVPQAVVLHVAANGTPLINVPIHFTVMPDGGTKITIAGNRSPSGDLRTDSVGNLTMNYTLGASPVQWIHFTASSTTAAADADFTLNSNTSDYANSGNTTLPSFTADFTPPALDATPVEVDPIYLVVKAPSYFLSTCTLLANHATLAWAVANPSAASFDTTLSYVIERKSGDYGAWAVIGTVNYDAENQFGSDDQNTGPFNFVFSDPDTLPGGHRYFYRVTAARNHILGSPLEATYTVPLFRSININTQTFSAGQDFFQPFAADPPDDNVYLEAETEVTGANQGSRTQFISTSPEIGDTFRGYGDSLYTNVTPVNLYPLVTTGDLGAFALNGIDLTTVSSTEADFDNGSDGDAAVTATVQLSAPYSNSVEGFELQAHARMTTVGDPDDPDSTIISEFDYRSYYPLGLYFSSPDSYNVAVRRSKYTVICFPSDLPISWSIVSNPDLHGYVGNWTVLEHQSMVPDSAGNTPIFYADDAANDYENENVDLVPDPSFTITQRNENLDPTEATSAAVMITAEPGDTWLNLFAFNSFGSPFTDDNSAEYAKVYWDAPDQLSLYYYDSGNMAYVPINPNDTLENFGVLFLYPAVDGLTADDGDYNLTIQYYDASDHLINSANVTFQVTVPENKRSVSLEEVAGAQYRKVALNGRPMPDGKPQSSSESDQQNEETFVDALTLALRYSVTDIYEEIPGLATPLAVNRVYQEETWSNRQGFRPHERIDQPFGPGWTSNVVPNVRWEDDYTYDAVHDLYHLAPISHVFATDEDGKEFHFLYNSQNDTYVPYPTGKHESNPYEASLADDGSGLVLTKKFGSKVYYAPATDVFDDSGNNSLLPDDRLAGSASYKGYSYYKATQVIGRGGAGNMTYLNYLGENPLIPSIIYASGSYVSRPGTFFVDNDTGPGAYASRLARSNLVTKSNPPAKAIASVGPLDLEDAFAAVSRHGFGSGQLRNVVGGGGGGGGYTIPWAYGIYIQIFQDSLGHVTEVSDSDGNSLEYNYVSIQDPIFSG